MTPKKPAPSGISFYQTEEYQLKGTHGKIQVNFKHRKFIYTGHFHKYCLFADQGGDGEEENEGMNHKRTYGADSNGYIRLSLYQEIFLTNQETSEDLIEHSIVLVGHESSILANSGLLTKIKRTTKLLKLLTNGGEINSYKMVLSCDTKE